LLFFIKLYTITANKKTANTNTNNAIKTVVSITIFLSHYNKQRKKSFLPSRVGVSETILNGLSLFSGQVLSLPVHPSVSEEDLQVIAQKVREFFVTG